MNLALRRVAKSVASATRAGLTIAALLAASLLAVTAPGASAATAGRTTASTDVESAASSYVVMLADSDEGASATTSRLARSLGFVPTTAYTNALRGFAAILTDEQVSKLRQHPMVRNVVFDVVTSAAGSKPSVRVRPELTPPGVRRIGAQYGGPANSAVAVLDTGLDLANPDLDAVAGVNCVKSGKSTQDDDGHGTHVGGTIGARYDDADVVGVAPGTRLYSVKVLDSSGKGRLSGLLCGIEWVRTNARRLDIRVANVSLTAAGTDDGACGRLIGDPLHAALCDSAAAGILYVAAAGNAGVDFARTVPAAYSEVLTVTAATDTDGLPGGTGGLACDEPDDVAGSYSNFATTTADAAHTLSGPGTCIASLKVGGGIETMLGTSMAAPHVAGAAARCFGSRGVAGPCASLASPSAVIDRLREDAAQRAQAGYGFAGDPLQPFAARRMGYLVSAVNY